MAWRLFSRRAETRAIRERTTARVRLNAEQLEDRVTPAAMTAYEVSALNVINQMRANPATFANDLRQLYLGGSYQSPTGYAASDPIWTDLRAQINESESTSSWRSGFTSTGANTFLTVASALAARAPLAWDAAVQDGSVGHDQWMFTNMYAHSVFTAGQAPTPSEFASNPIPGIPRNFNVATGDYFNYFNGLGLNSAAENISYGYNIGGATFNAYSAGQITLDGYYQRLVYADVIGFMMEFNNGGSNPWGHLQNLTGNFNVTGISNFFYENPVEGTADGVSESYFATERFGRRNGASYANVLAYLDANNNNVYDSGEGLAGQVSFNFGAASLTLPATGFSSLTLPTSGSYTVSANYQGNNLGTQSVIVDGTNKTLVFRVTSLIDLTPPVSQVTRLPVYETSPNFLVQWSSTDIGSGTASYNVYVAVDGGSFTLWQNATTLTQATYAGTMGHRYAFYSTAIDNAGNQQATPSGAQTSTEIRAFDVAAPSNLVAIASQFTNSSESYAIFVRQAYLTYLGRTADAGGLAYWVDQMNRGLATDQIIEAKFLAAPEYVSAHGGGGSAWIISLYQDLLGRTPSSLEVIGAQAALKASGSMTSFALGFVNSGERAAIRIRQNYQTYLGRTPSVGEVNAWVDQFVNRGMTSETMAAQFVGSREFFNQTTKGASTFSVWVVQAYQLVLQRTPSAGEVSAWVARLNAPANIGSFALSAANSPESFRFFITNAYTTYLGRTPDLGGMNYWLDQMTRRLLSDEQLEARFIGSSEYILNHGGAGAGWVTGMYVDLLQRTPSLAEVSAWVARLNAGASTETVALGFAASAEREGLRVRQNYRTFLGRVPSPGEVNDWVTQFTTRGMTNETMSALFVSSPEYFRNTAKGNGNIIQWLDAVFADILHRPITLAELLAIAPTIQ
jgi:hypothetical protein